MFAPSLLHISAILAKVGVSNSGDKLGQVFYTRVDIASNFII